jgi:hypothetical protein
MQIMHQTQDSSELASHVSFDIRSHIITRIREQNYLCVHDYHMITVKAEYVIRKIIYFTVKYSIKAQTFLVRTLTKNEIFSHKLVFVKLVHRCNSQQFKIKIAHLCTIHSREK